MKMQSSMKIKFLSLFLFLFCTNSQIKAVTITEGIYEGTSQYIIKTRTATYYFDKAGGGISRLIDRDGNDWVALKREPRDRVPDGAAFAFRGMPNAVYLGDDGGCGHPGFDQCISVLEGNNTIRSRSKSGKWEWTWTFYEDHAVWEVVKTDTARNYWFLYEGPVGGSFEPGKSFWGNNEKGPGHDTPSHMDGEGISGNWDWAYFGRDDRNSVLFVMHDTPDNQADYFSYMGNSSAGIQSPDGMVVFGFGRNSGNNPLLNGNHRFIIGLQNPCPHGERRHAFLSKRIQRYCAGNQKSGVGILKNE